MFCRSPKWPRRGMNPEHDELLSKRPPKEEILLTFPKSFVHGNIYTSVVTLETCRTSHFKDSFIQRTARLWNTLPWEVFLEAFNLQKFKKNTNFYLLSLFVRTRTSKIPASKQKYIEHESFRIYFFDVEHIIIKYNIIINTIHQAENVVKEICWGKLRGTIQLCVWYERFLGKKTSAKKNLSPVKSRDSSQK